MSTAASLPLLPRPTEIARAEGGYRLDEATIVRHDGGADDAAALVHEHLQSLGLDPLVESHSARSGIELRFDHSDEALGSEGYRLEVDADGVRVTAAGPVGLLHGVQTLRQLLPVDGFATGGPAEPPADGWLVPALRIRDVPRFGWRGSLLDPARWFLPIDYLHRYVDVLAMHKMNRLHLHLTDDQGWRIEIDAYPELTRVGSRRRESSIGVGAEAYQDGTEHGGFYTKTQLRELVAYARARGVEIVPEIDLPGHMTAAIAAYPKLGNDPDTQLRVSTHWGIHSTVLSPQETTMQFVEQVLREVMDVFPSPWIHIGGDECPTEEWLASPVAQAQLAELGLSDARGLQEWFMNRTCSFLRSHGRIPIVWDEAATPGLTPSAVVMAWTTAEAGYAAAARGHRVIQTPQQVTYFDFYQSDAPGQPPARPEVTTLADVMAFEPAPDQLAPAARDCIIGTQAQLWGEHLSSPERVDDMAFPRLCALAERAWSDTSIDPAEFLPRLAVTLDRLRAAGFSPRALES